MAYAAAGQPQGYHGQPHMGIRHGPPPPHEQMVQDAHRYYTAMRYTQDSEIMKQTDKYFDDRHFAYYEKQLLEKQA